MEQGGVLIVEDNHVNQLILRAMLRKSGCDPIVAADGFQGVEMAEVHQPRLVLMDLHMPGMDGFAALAEIRRRVGGASMAVFAVTANPSDAQKVRCEAAGFAGMLLKPLNFDEVSEVVRKWGGSA